MSASRKTLIAILVLACLGHTASLSAARLSGDVKLGNIQFEGSNGRSIQNFSGATSDGYQIVLIDDGGYPLPSTIYMLEPNLQSMAVTAAFELPSRHIDLESAAFVAGSYLFSTSWTVSEPEPWAGQWLTRIKVDPVCSCVTETESVNIRGNLIAALKNDLDQEWVNRVLVASTKKGGINLEGMSHDSENEGDIIFGLRSPLFDLQFGDPSLGSRFSLRKGKAIIVKARHAFGKQPELNLELLDLEGLGIRSLEYISALDRYAIIAGFADVGNNYAVWLWDSKKNHLEKVHLPELDKLCRPESVVQIDLKDESRLLIVSEQSGKPCVDQ